MRVGLRLSLFLALICLTAGATELTYALRFELSEGEQGWYLEGEATITGRAPAATDVLVFRFFRGADAPVALRAVRAG
ncbi:MAG: hypothetical protein GXO72_00725, partial [Caldiserica bacterium]|nr:hypothetical protein [Caldisericota bacterium]